MSAATIRPSLWRLGGLSPLRLGIRVWKDIGEDETSVRSTSLAYYFVLAVFPALPFILSILGFWASTGSRLEERLFSNLS